MKSLHNDRRFKYESSIQYTQTQRLCPLSFTFPHTHLFIFKVDVSHTDVCHTKKGKLTQNVGVILAIGDSPLSSLLPHVFLLPVHYYSQSPYTHHNLALLFSVGKRQQLYFTLQQRCPIQIVPYGHTPPHSRVFPFRLQ